MLGRMTSTEMPRWATDDLYAGLDDPRLSEDFAALERELRDLGELFGQLDVRAGGGAVTPDGLAQVLDALNALLTRLQTLGAYVTAFVATDSRNAAAQQRQGELTQLALPHFPGPVEPDRKRQAARQIAELSGQLGPGRAGQRYRE